jgi:intein/homing endonuclease
MNVFLPQDLDARAELLNLSTTKHNIMTSQSTKNIICITQDSLLGSFMLTREDIDLGRELFFDICMKGDGWSSDYIIKRLEMVKKVMKDNNANFPLYCGKTLFSLMLPASLNYTKKNDARKDEPVVKIVKGVMLEGALVKGNLGQAHNSIIHVLHKEYGMDKAIDFINNCQFISNQYLLHRGFSIGIQDCVSTDEMSKKTEEIAYRAFIESKDTETTISHDRIRELKVCSILDNARDRSMKLAKGQLDKENGFVATVTSGSKGEYFNLAQITSMLGQQMHMGKRIEKTLNRGKRTLPHYPVENIDIEQEFESRGFIKHSFLHGLNPQEFIWHAMTGREGCSDTAMKSVTWETPIVIIENGRPKYTEIGKWIDALLFENEKQIQHYTDRQMELLDTNNIYIPTMDENGVVTWGEVTAVTRHDPGVQLYEIKTKSGRNVTVTESKSLLIWNKNKQIFEEVLTPDIVVGDFVPVTAELCKPPMIIDSVDLKDYFPKTQYIYGTEYNKAVEMMNCSMENKEKIEKGWWCSHNGVDFVLPYSKKSSLQRSSIRSSNEIKNGLIYSYNSNRKNFLKEFFELNEENGMFIGLFLAEGNISNDSIRITNMNENIKNFVKKWFDSHSIHWDEEDRMNAIGGRTCSVRGFSGILSDFLIKFVCNGSDQKHVPSEAFTAPESFILGLLNGYFSGDGCVTKNSIEATSVSKRLIEGVNMLCSRIGVFGKVNQINRDSNNLGTKNIKPCYHLRITANWASLFSQKINLLDEVKNEKMKSKKWCEKSLSFESLNNVILDEIVEINLVDIKDHPKVYDLTIPSTLNFGLANGLQVRDTAQSGYVQRKMVKVMEDVQVKYDGTVRNTLGWVINWSYGGDGFDRSECAFVGDSVTFCDPVKIADRLNNESEE